LVVNGPNPDNWQLSTLYAVSGTNSWHSGADPSGGGGSTALVIGTFTNLPPLSFFRFQHRYDFFVGIFLDGGIIEITTNDGTNWMQITPKDGYDGSYRISGDFFPIRTI